jgi:hypothetical protein
MPTAPTRSIQSSVAIEDITGLKERSLGQRLVSSQPFWVTVALIIMCGVMSVYQPQAFASADNFYNITRNFAFIGIMAVGMTAVILTGGSDLSVGSIMGVVRGYVHRDRRRRDRRHREPGLGADRARAAVRVHLQLHELGQLSLRDRWQ